MAARSVRFHPDALAEGQAAYEWYRDRNPSAANAFVAELDHAIRQIQDNSEGWPMHMHGTRKFVFRRFSLPGDLSDHRIHYPGHRCGSRTPSSRILEVATILEKMNS